MLPVKVKVGVIYINIVVVFSVCQRHLAASFLNNIDFLKGLYYKNLSGNELLN